MKKIVYLFITMLIMTGPTWALNHSGWINTETWYASDNPHIITNHVRVSDGEILTIEAGCVIKFDGNYRLQVYGAIHANGTDTDHIIFTSNETSPQEGDWRSIELNGADAGSYLNYCDISYGGSSNDGTLYLNSTASGNATISNCIIEYSENYGVRENYGGTVISNSIIRNGSDHGFYLNGSASSIISCTIDNNDGFGIYYRNDWTPATVDGCTISNNSDYAIRIFAENVTNLSGIFNITGNTPNAIRLEGGYASSGTMVNPGVPYVVKGNIEIDDGATFIIEEGTEIRFDGNYYFRSYGALIADGTAAEPIIFTSNESSPDAGDWSYIQIDSPDATSILDYCEIRYGGGSNNMASVQITSADTDVSISNCIIEEGHDHGVRVRWGDTQLSIENTIIRNHTRDGINLDWGGNVDVDNCLIENNAAFGIYCIGADEVATVSNTSILNNGDYAIRTYADNARFLASSTTISGNTPDAVWLGQDDIYTGTWYDLDAPFVIGENYSGLVNGETLAIEAGTEIQFDGQYTLEIYGEINAAGTAENPIVFSSTSSSNWTQIYIDGADAGSYFDYCNFDLGGRSDGNVYLTNSASNISFSNCNFTNSRSNGIYISNSSPDITDCNFDSNRANGAFVTSASPSFLNCYFTNSVQNNGVELQNASPSFINCTMTDNDDYGIEVLYNSYPTFGSNNNEWNAIYGNYSGYEFRGYNVPITAEYVFWGNTNCIGDPDDLIWDDNETGWYSAVDYVPYIGNAQIGFDVLTTWEGDVDTDWNDDDNWDNCKPCAEISALIPAAPSDQPVVSTTPEEVLDLTLEKDAKLTVQNGNSLEVYGDLYLGADASTSSSLIDFGSFNVQGEVYADFYLDENRWHYLSSPVDGAVSEVFLGIYLIDWDEATQTWSYIVPTNVPLSTGTGFGAWSAGLSTGNAVATFTGGDLNSGNISYTLTATDANTNLTIDADEGWNLVGNPYPSAVDWDYTGWTKTNITSSVYVYDGTQYLYWNGSVGNLTNGVIPAMQAFYVKAFDSNPALSVSNSTRLHDAAPYKNDVDNLIAMKLQGENFMDEGFIHFKEGSSNDFDLSSDAYKMFGDEVAPQLYSLSHNDQLSINTLPKAFDGMIIPLGTRIGSEGEYTLSFEGISELSNVPQIKLYDAFENVEISLEENTSYNFYANPNDPELRFSLHFGNANEIEEVYQNTYQVYASGNTINIQSLSNRDAYLVNVYTMSGALVYSEKYSDASNSVIELSKTDGYYLVQIIDQEGLQSHKVFIK